MELRSLSPVLGAPSLRSMNTAEPPVVLVRDDGTERWRIEARSFSRLRQALGPDVTNAFCRCFVHADRLTSLIGFVFSSEERYGNDSPPFHRDLQTMVWFTVGTLRELALAIRDLRSAMAKRGTLDINAAPWEALREVERRWEDDPFYRSMRNIVAFHVDPEMTEKGLEALAKQERVVLIQGEGRPQRHTFLWNVIRTGSEDFGSLFIGVIALFGVHRGVWLLRTMSVGREGGARFGASISGAAPDTAQEHLAAVPIGVIRVMRAFSPQQRGLSGGGARAWVVEHLRFLHQSDVRDPAAAGGHVEGCADGQHAEAVRLGRWAPLCGRFARGCPRGPASGRGAHSSDRITSGCT